MNIVHVINMALRFDGRVAIITGAGNGIGREYALEFAKRGAKVVVNDLGVNRLGEGSSSRAADVVVEEIRALGGEAVASHDSVEQGDRIVKTALDAFGRVDILINNAGILKDSSFLKMTEAHWDPIVNVNLKGAFLLSRAAWGEMRKQKYGRIIYTSSGSGLYGNFGQANYAAAKMGLNGLSSTLAKEGGKYNINVNTIAPMAITRLTDDVMSPDVKELFPPYKIIPAVVWLCHESCSDSGQIFEIGGGLYTKVRLQRSKGLLITTDHGAEEVKAGWENVNDFSETDYPESNNDIIIKRFQMANKTSSGLDSTTIVRAVKGFAESGRLRDVFAEEKPVIHFEVKQESGEVDVYTLDMVSPSVMKGAFGVPSSVISVTENDFVGIAKRELTPSQAYEEGKLGLSGDISLAFKFLTELLPAVTPGVIMEFANARL